MLLLNLEQRDDTLHVIISGNLTKRNIYQLEYYMIPYIQKYQIKQLLCDCKKLKKIDYEGKYALLKTKMILKEQHGKMVLFDVKESIKNSLIGYRMHVQ